MIVVCQMFGKTKLFFRHYGFQSVLNRNLRINLYNFGIQKCSSLLRHCAIDYLKLVFCFEKYISELSPYYMYILCKFRCGSHRLPVETGRWRNLPRSERVCSLCDSMDIGDEYHYIMTCSYFINERINLLPPFCHENVNIYKFEQLFASNNVIVLEKLCKFIKNVQEKVVPPG